jgi:hypothetical protein
MIERCIHLSLELGREEHFLHNAIKNHQPNPDSSEKNGASDRIRTCNPRFTKPLRYRCATLACHRPIMP